MEATPKMPKSALKTAKTAVLTGARTFGVYSAFRRSTWRKHRLLILGYHGISLQDEHLWRPGLFMAPDQFTSRLETVSRMGCTVLPLGEALEQLQLGTLPPMSVAITFDDGFYNFFAAAYPILQQFKYPATLYQTTFYVAVNKPIFHLLCHYLLWKASGTAVDAYPIIGRKGQLDLTTKAGVNVAGTEIWNFARTNHLSPTDREQLAKTLADSVGLDYQEIVDHRLFNLMNPEELTKLVNSGLDVQLHTHRHRVPASKELFLKELRDNQEFLTQIGQGKATHFTYPSGVYRDEVFPWLAEFGVRSATTCKTGLASTQSNPMCLPRFIDVPDISNLEFEAWLCGVRDVLPGRANGNSRARS
jgi:peptidoglycan/xylan/chitin deacetylase (PgdA/CDA1 family)